KGEIALAQIYGLRILIGELDDASLQKLAAVSRLIKAGFDPNEPRIPAGEPDAGQWTFEEGYAKPRRGEPGAESDDPESTGSEGASGPGGGGAPLGASDSESPKIPDERPETARERNSTARRAAEWLKRAIGLGAQSAPSPQVRAFLRIIETTWWLADNVPKIQSYLDAPKPLEELQRAVGEPRAGYERHHVVEGQYASDDPLANSRRFGRDQLESPENLVQIPYFKH